jgi:hypothetical protein
MAVAALSTAGFSQYVSASSNVSASQQAFQALQQNLAMGNLTAAKTAFDNYQQLSGSTATDSGAATSSSSSPASAPASSPLATDMASLGTALNAGNLAKAQTAFATVQSDLKSTPPQAVVSAESAASQTVQWIDDLLSLTSANDAPAARVDPMTAILDSVFGLNSSTSTTDPTTAILDSAYGIGSAGSNGGAANPTVKTAVSGNVGSAASVNAFA